MSKHPYSFEISEELDDLALSPYAFRLYGHLKRQLDNNGGPEGVKELAERCRMSVESVTNALQPLLDHGLIEVIVLTPQGAETTLKRKQSQTFRDTRFGLRVCEWCKATTVAIQRHHYPVPKSDGGTETVAICASCHAEYHILTNGIIRALSLTEE